MGGKTIDRDEQPRRGKKKWPRSGRKTEESVDEGVAMAM